MTKPYWQHHQTLNLAGSHWYTAPSFEDAAALWAVVERDEPEGVGAKPLRSTYKPGDRDADARLFVGVTADRLRTVIGRACKAAGVPVFSPHDPRTPADQPPSRSGPHVGRDRPFRRQRKLSITSDTYTHVLSDGAEVDYLSLRTRTPVGLTTA